MLPFLPLKSSTLKNAVKYYDFSATIIKMQSENIGFNKPNGDGNFTVRLFSGCQLGYAEKG